MFSHSVEIAQRPRSLILARSPYSLLSYLLPVFLDLEDRPDKKIHSLIALNATLFATILWEAAKHESKGIRAPVSLSSQVGARCLGELSFGLAKPFRKIV